MVVLRGTQAVGLGPHLSHLIYIYNRLVDLARLSIESEIARKINFDNVITRFALKKAKKAPLNVIVK
jgi:hypothetical protein